MIAIADQKGEVGKITTVTVAADDAFEIAFYFSITPKAFILIIRSEGLITRRSQVQVLPPLLDVNQRPPGYPKQASPAVFDSESLPKKEIFNEPATSRLERQ